MAGGHILLVEDDAILRDLLRRNLEARQHEVRIADDAQSALEALRSTTFDLVILDINLPDQTGWEVLRIAERENSLPPQVRDGNGPHLPVVVVSAVRVSLTRLKEFPLLAYLPKPFPIEALLRLAGEAAGGKAEHVQQPAIMSSHPRSQYPGVLDARWATRSKGKTIDE